VTRVAREVGTEGKLAGQAIVPGVGGTWKDLTDNVNSMGSNLTAQVRNIADVATAVANGDLSKKITVDAKGEILELKNTINTMVDQLNGFASEVSRVAREVGTEGKLGGQAQVRGVAGTWKDLTDNVNSMASNLTAQVRNIADVATAIARGDLSRKITVDVKGEILQLKKTMNTMVDQLNAFASEVSRVAREVGTEGKLGGQAQVPDVAGTWKDLTDNVNSMANNLTGQVRNIAQVTTAVARGDLSRKITVDVKGEILELKDTINTMVDQLNAFASEVSRVAREVGTEGKLGGQAEVSGVAGTWKDLTDNVNLLAANLTTQVRAIAEVATAVTKGDLTRSIQVEARGEVAELKDNINTMIDNLRVTTERNKDQDWLKTNLAKFTRMLQGQRDLFTVGEMLLSELAPLVNAERGTIYQMISPEGERPSLRRLASYAGSFDLPEIIALGEGLVGQCAKENQRILLSDLPSNYMPIHSSLGAAKPAAIVVLPVLFEGQTKAVIELASLQKFTEGHLSFLEQLTQSIGVVLNTIEATMRTEGLLQQSQQLTVDLRAGQRELQQTNEELEQKARQLAEQNAEVERKNMEIEQARSALEDKAAELALTSKYKSEFLANMSHELRTPLNSILILGQQLAENATGNLHSKQIEFARNIHSAGTDLLNLINDILDLSKIESGTVTVEAEEISFASLRESVERSFRHIAESKNLPFVVEFDPRLPEFFTSDSKRLQQIIKNLLSNAFKFTARGQVRMEVRLVESGWSPDHPSLSRADAVVALAIIDSGIGIAQEKQGLMFEAFQQADAGTSRKYGGTGLGLAISRELASLLGGEIRLTSKPSQGSTFTLFLPLVYTGPAAPATTPVSVPLTQTTSLALPIMPISREERIPDDRHEIAGEEATALIVEDDPHYARILLGLARDRGFKGARGHARQRGHFASATIPAKLDHVGHLPPGHARVDCASQFEVGSRNSPHPRPDHHHGG
jgi:signal transduction histidine kinase/HAMP domain-containing protein